MLENKTAHGEEQRRLRGIATAIATMAIGAVLTVTLSGGQATATGGSSPTTPQAELLPPAGAAPEFAPTAVPFVLSHHLGNA
jgi:hypothetical protein